MKRHQLHEDLKLRKSPNTDSAYGLKSYLTSDIKGKKVLVAKPVNGNNLKNLEDYSPMNFTCEKKS